jgi:hypothetical protein
MEFKTTELTIPSHWLSAIINGDESSFDYYDDPADYAAYQEFCNGKIPPMAIVDPYDEDGETDSEFMSYHDARPYGVLPCDCVTCKIHVPITEAS